jgi:hypothetical protein
MTTLPEGVRMTHPARRKISLGFTRERFDEGHHIIYVYNDDRERKRTMASFIGEGLHGGEKVLYLVSDISTAEMRSELQSLGVAMDECRDDFDLTEGHHTRCPGGHFSSAYMLDIVGKYYDQAIDQGYTGARGAGEMSWALVEGRCSIPELLRYEARLNTILADHPLTTICQYDARRFDGALIMDLMSVHPMMIVRGQLVNNPCYVAPDTFLREYTRRPRREDPKSATGYSERGGAGESRA